MTAIHSRQRSPDVAARSHQAKEAHISISQQKQKKPAEILFYYIKPNPSALLMAVVSIFRSLSRFW